MVSFKRVVATIAASVLVAGSLAACSSAEDGPSVYFLNFKPEQDAIYQKIAAAYTEETGVPVKVVTAASGTYEQTLKAEVGKRNQPTLFQVNGIVGLKKWSKFTADLTDATFTKELNDSIDPLTGDDGKIRAVPFAVEGYGILYNEEIFDKYCAMEGAKVSSPEEIKDFATLKKVSEDMQANKKELGIDGAFASTSLASGEAWRWQTHLANIPIHYELQDLGTDDSDNLQFTYNKEYKNLFDLYLNNSTVEKTLAPSKSVSDSMAEFAQGKAAMVQNGNWAWGQISEVSGNVIKEDKLKFLPMYTGMPEDSKQGLAVGTENYLAVNQKASEEDQKATIDFVNWLYTTDKGKEYVVKELGFIAPFKTFSKDDIPDDPLAKQIADAMDNPDLESVPWDFQTFPSQQFKNDFGQDLAQYASGKTGWDEVVRNFVDNWAAEKAALK